ncbi:Origin recognition complex subunit 5 [Rhynchospora pubera]|uniref:Origin recognition complex subunit 5 n=1 Tax=Rhynchospora pubera TaxID=906938 RepID=A0AAV8CZ45_9POAL|nr:Origin recognition complex subunit 5 [Rhynchospora pubera]
MGKQPKTPESARRTTRSASSVSPAPTPSKPSAPPKTPELSSSLNQLLSSLPGRKAQILDLIRFLGPSNAPCLPLLLYGNASTGKTSTVLKVLEHLKRPFVYASCRSCHNPRILFESVLSQLGSNQKRCKKMSDFFNYLKEALAERNNGEMVYLIFDSIESVRSWDNGSKVLSLLLTLYDKLQSDGLGLIYISRSTPDVYLLSFGMFQPIDLCFPDYTFEEAHSILMRNQAYPKLYSSFLSVVLRPFTRVTRRIDELALALDPLYKKYCEPLTDLTIIPNEAMKRRLCDYIWSHVTAALNQTFTIPPRALTEKGSTGGIKRQLSGLGNETGLSELDFHMSVSAKYLLISAFLASRNPATLDAALFDSTGGCDGRKRKRKSSQSVIDKKNTRAEEMLTKGPGTFPLERLLAIFQCITSVLEEDCPLNEGKPLENGIGMMSDVLLQLSTLCNSSFLCKSGNCPLEGSVRYRSMIDEDMALKVARSVNFPLSNYVYRR